MKKITETKLINIVNKVLNEQKIRQFDEDELELLHFIFERELKPPFQKGKKDNFGRYSYYNRDGDCVGWLKTRTKYFMVTDSFWDNIKYKICSAFGFSYDTWDWWYAIKPNLKSWLEDQLNVKFNNIH